MQIILQYHTMTMYIYILSALLYKTYIKKIIVYTFNISTTVQPFITLHTCLNKEAKGITFGLCHVNALLYADDLVLIADKPETLNICYGH